jgi:hypothetical protein
MNDKANGHGNPALTAASELRLAQVALADQSDQSQRQRILKEQLDRILQKIEPASRPAFLEQLAEQFPAWEEERPAAPEPEAAPQPRQPEEVVEELIELAPSLSKAQKQTIADALARAGIIQPGGSDLPAGAMQGVRQKLGIAESDPVKPTRLMELLEECLDFTIERVVWETWQAVAPQARIRRNGKLDKTFAAFVTDKGKSRKDVQQELAKLRMMNTLFMTAVPQSYRFASSFYQAIFPNRIEATVDKGMFFEKRCWLKYRELAASHSEADAEFAMKQEIQEFVEKFWNL